MYIQQESPVANIINDLLSDVKLPPATVEATVEPRTIGLIAITVIVLAWIIKQL